MHIPNEFIFILILIVLFCLFIFLGLKMDKTPAIIMLVLAIITAISIVWLGSGGPVSIKKIKDSNITVEIANGTYPVYLVTINGEVHEVHNVREYVSNDGLYYVTYTQYTDISGNKTGDNYLLYVPMKTETLQVAAQEKENK